MVYVYPPESLLVGCKRPVLLGDDMRAVTNYALDVTEELKACDKKISDIRYWILAKRSEDEVLPNDGGSGDNSPRSGRPDGRGGAGGGGDNRGGKR